MKRELKVLEKRVGIEGFRFIFGRTPRAISKEEDHSFYISLDLKEGHNSWYVDPEKGKIEESLFKFIFGEVDFRWFQGNNLYVSQSKMESLIEVLKTLPNFKLESVKDEECGAGDWTWLIIESNLESFERNLEKVKEVMVENLFDGKVPVW